MKLLIGGAIAIWVVAVDVMCHDHEPHVTNVYCGAKTDQKIEQQSCESTHWGTDQTHITPSPQQTRVAFSVKHNGNTIAGLTHTPIAFDVIVRNDLDAYNIAKKAFVVPIKGVYSLHYSAASKEGYMASFLHSSAHGWLNAAIAGMTDTQTSNSIIIELDEEVEIRVKIYPGHQARICSPPCSTFSGHLLYPTE